MLCIPGKQSVFIIIDIKNIFVKGCKIKIFYGTLKMLD